MTLYRSQYVAGNLRSPDSLTAGEVVSQLYVIPILATYATGDIIEAFPLPAGMTVEDAVLISDALDESSSPPAAMAIDVGIMSGGVGEDDGTRTCGDELFDGVTTQVRAGGVLRMTEADGFKIAGSDSNRSIGIKLVAGSAAPVAGNIRLRVGMASAG